MKYKNLLTLQCYIIFFSPYLVDCFKALLSKGLGLAIILGSILVKVPQILKIVNNRSAEGINLFAVFLEIVVITLNLSYSFVKGFPFTAWGKCEAHAGALKIHKVFEDYASLHESNFL